MLCALVFLTTGAIASSSSEIIVDGHTTFANNTAYLYEGGETLRTPRLSSALIASVMDGKATISSPLPCRLSLSNRELPGDLAR